MGLPIHVTLIGYTAPGYFWSCAHPSLYHGILAFRSGISWMGLPIHVTLIGYTAPGYFWSCACVCVWLQDESVCARVCILVCAWCFGVLCKPTVPLAFPNMETEHLNGQIWKAIYL